MREQQQTYDYVILGAGPAGLQMAYYLQGQGRSYLVLEKGPRPGTFFETFPRHRKMISINKVYTGYADPEINLRWDWNSLLSSDTQLRFPNFSKAYFPAASDFLSYLRMFAERYALNIKYRTTVCRVAKPGEFVVEDADGKTYRCRRLVVATGMSRPYIPDVPGIELGEPYSTVSVDPEDFANQRVLILGKGNSAFETADNLMGAAALIHVASPNPLKLAWKTHFVGHLRAVNNDFLDTYRLKLQNALLDASLLRADRVGNQIQATFRYTHASGEVETILYDRMILCTGFRFDTSIFDRDCQPELAHHGKLPAQTSGWESTNIRDLFFAGTLMQARDYKKQMSSFIHGFRYNIQALARMLRQRDEGAPLPAVKLEHDAEAITEAIIERINLTSALWQQPGFLGDVITIGPSSAMLHEELPVDYAHDQMILPASHALIVTLEFGHSEEPDPFNVDRIHREDVRHAEASTFLHPVVRHYKGNELVAVHHVIEDLAAEWREDVHVEPLRDFVRTVLSACWKEQDRPEGQVNIDMPRP